MKPGIIIGQGRALWYTSTQRLAAKEKINARSRCPMMRNDVIPKNSGLCRGQMTQSPIDDDREW